MKFRYQVGNQFYPSAAALNLAIVDLVEGGVPLDRIEIKLAAPEVPRCKVLMGDLQCTRSSGHDGCHIFQQSLL